MTVGMRHASPCLRQSISGALGIQGYEFPETFDWPPN